MGNSGLPALCLCCCANSLPLLAQACTGLLLDVQAADIVLEHATSTNCLANLKSLDVVHLLFSLQQYILHVFADCA